MTTTEFVVPGKPEPQRRARATARGGYTRMYDPKENLRYADRIRQAWREAGAVEFKDELIRVHVFAVMERPKGHFRKNGELSAAGLRAPSAPSKTPDWDNVGKAVGDALNGHAFKDDRQIVSGYVKKEWTRYPGEIGRLRVLIQSWDLPG